MFTDLSATFDCFQADSQRYVARRRNFSQLTYALHELVVVDEHAMHRVALHVPQARPTFLDCPIWPNLELDSSILCFMRFTNISGNHE